MLNAVMNNITNPIGFERLLDSLLAGFVLIDWMNSVAGRAILVSVAVGVTCALAGTMLVIRRQSLMGDAISHAVLPGLAMAFLLSGSLGTGAMLLGALAAGLLTTFLTETLSRRGGVSADSALGVVYTSLFAIGVILVKRFLHGVHFDVKCVYEGSLLNAVLETHDFNFLGYGLQVPQALVATLGVLISLLFCKLLLWKELRLCAFDPALATTMGFSATAMHYLVMALVAVTAAVSFEAVGAILVVAMMIAPAATAQLLTDRLAPMTLIAASLAALYGVIGFQLSVAWDVSSSGMMACLAGVGYLVAAIASPRHGAFAQLIASMRMAWQVRRDDLLALLFRHEERGYKTNNTEEILRAIGGGFWASRALSTLTAQQMVNRESESLALTDKGRKQAAKLVRSHRLWEKYLVEEVGIKEDHVHEPAHIVEHYLDPQLEAKLDALFEGSTQDPHGRQIPIVTPSKDGADRD